MKKVLVYTKLDFPKELQKISSCLYHDREADTFYRLNVMPALTAFIFQNVEKRQLMTLTKFDPMFLMINLIYMKKKIKHSELSEYLKNKNWSLLSQVSLQESPQFQFSRTKIFDYLEKKVQKMEEYIWQKNPLDTIKLLELQAKTISQDTISLLKSQINPELVQQFTKQRYGVKQSRKTVPQVQQFQAFKPKPKKKGGKNVTLSLQKNQKILFPQWSKK